MSNNEHPFSPRVVCTFFPFLLFIVPVFVVYGVIKGFRMAQQVSKEAMDTL